MNTHKNLQSQLVITGFGIIIWVSILVFLAYDCGERYFYSIMLIGVPVIVFFSLLSCPGNVDEKGSFKESRVRLAITATLLMVYCVYFGSIVYLDKTFDENGKEVITFGKEIFPTLTDFLMVVLPFYFASKAAVEIANIRWKNDNVDKTT